MSPSVVNILFCPVILPLNVDGRAGVSLCASGPLYTADVGGSGFDSVFFHNFSEIASNYNERETTQLD